MDTDTEVLPEVEQTAADVEGAEKPAVEGEKQPEAKPEKTPEQREIERLRRGIDRRTRQLSEARAQLGLTSQQNSVNLPATASDSEPLSLTRAELERIVNDEAKKLAPTLAQQEAAVNRRQGVIQSLAKTWGQERFDSIASDLDHVMGGLMDSSGKAKPAIEAVFESDNPAAVIEYLSNPDNDEEAETIAAMSAVQAGRAIAKLEAKLAVKADTVVSKAPAPLQAVKSRGSIPQGPSDTDSIDEWVRKERQRLKQRG